MWCQCSMVLGGLIVGEGDACVCGSADALCCSGCALCSWLRIRWYQRCFVALAVCLYLSPSWFLVTSAAVASVGGRSWFATVVLIELRDARWCVPPVVAVGVSMPVSWRRACLGLYPCNIGGSIVDLSVIGTTRRRCSFLLLTA